MDSKRKDRKQIKEDKDKVFLDRVEKMIENFENNCAGPYYTNRDITRRLAKNLGVFKKKRYALTDEDYKRLEAERLRLDELKRTRRERSEASRTA